MANPQLEDGYLKIANELYEAWMRTRVPGEAEQVLKAVIRKTYGFNKKMDRISISQIASMTKMSSSHVCRAMKILLKMSIVTKKGSSNRPTYGIQKNYDKWKPLPKRVIRPNTVVPKKGDTKDITYKNNKKEIPGKPDINIHNLWQEHIKDIQMKRWRKVFMTESQVNLLINAKEQGGRFPRPGFGSYIVLASTLEIVPVDIENMFAYLKAIANDGKAVNRYIGESNKYPTPGFVVDALGSVDET